MDIIGSLLVYVETYMDTSLLVYVDVYVDVASNNNEVFIYVCVDVASMLISCMLISRATNRKGVGQAMIDMLPTDVVEDVKEKYEGIHECIYVHIYINICMYIYI